MNVVRIAGFQDDSIVDGEGIRLTIFFQGCPHHCRGCQNPQTWDTEKGTLYDIEDVKNKIRENPLIQGITLSGGEPLLQPLAVKELSSFAHSIGKDVWMYTGYTWEEIVKSCALGFLEDVDVLVDGRYDDKLRSLGLKYRGSSNQRVINVQKSSENRVFTVDKFL